MFLLARQLLDFPRAAESWVILSAHHLTTGSADVNQTYLPHPIDCSMIGHWLDKEHANHANETPEDQVICRGQQIACVGYKQCRDHRGGAAEKSRGSIITDSSTA